MLIKIMSIIIYIGRDMAGEPAGGSPLSRKLILYSFPPSFITTPFISAEKYEDFY
jgi:hypothetical protein